MTSSRRLRVGVLLPQAASLVDPIATQSGHVGRQAIAESCRGWRLARPVQSCDLARNRRAL